MKGKQERKEPCLVSQQGCNCGFGLVAAVSEDMILADTNPIAHCVDTRHHFSASVVPDTLPFPFLHSSLTHKKPPSVHTMETCQCSPAGTAVHRGPCWGFRTAWPPASPLLLALILCEVPKAQATVDWQDRPRNTHMHTHTHTHIRSTRKLSSITSRQYGVQAFTLSQHPCLGDSVNSQAGGIGHPSSFHRQ